MGIACSMSNILQAPCGSGGTPPPFDGQTGTGWVYTDLVPGSGEMNLGEGGLQIAMIDGDGVDWTAYFTDPARVGQSLVIEQPSGLFWRMNAVAGVDVNAPDNVVAWGVWDVQDGGQPAPGPIALTWMLQG